MEHRGKSSSAAKLCSSRYFYLSRTNINETVFLVGCEGFDLISCHCKEQVSGIIIEVRLYRTFSKLCINTIVMMIQRMIGIPRFIAHAAKVTAM